MACSNDDLGSLPFVADAVVRSLRHGQLPEAGEAECLNQARLVDRMRTFVREDDAEWLLALAETQEPCLAGLAATLLQPVADREDVSIRLQQLWKSTSSPYLRTILTWRLLDNPRLDFGAWNRPLFDFLMQEWPVAKEQILQFWSSPEEVVPRVMRRLADPSVPASKKWVYLCNLPEVAADPAEARAILEGAAEMLEDPFAQEVAARLLARFYPHATRSAV